MLYCIYIVKLYSNLFLMMNMKNKFSKLLLIRF